MSKLVINYDMIDKIYESQGKHNLRRCYKHHATRLPGFFCGIHAVKDIVALQQGGLNGEILTDLAQWTAGYFVLLPMLDKTFDYLLNRFLDCDLPIEQAIETLRILSSQLNSQNIKTTPKLLLNSKVYHRKYKLDMEGTPGVIRQRYINIPTFDFNGKEQETSILEEHKMGSKKYVLSLGTPKKVTALKPVYNV